ncbi:dynamin family protein [Ornithinimicrobium sp. F0845]|uniref:dynamin family protein n=1 Tax=Ornithinimicrobium sp. F0845 TaxID=2926412 RepID=UPI001FF5570A|nr:dynamin family protein [Ornithinimicrobium sp. F0845]MCK0113079.1 dynamin family protein [Ornithinimicrobium sp. F0845]
MSESLVGRVGTAVDRAADRAPTAEAAQELRALRARLDGPLRLAIAGRVKAGKSTLLNALVGENLAPTDAGECTRVVTWYSYGAAPRVLLHPLDGPPVDRPFQRDDGALNIDLGGRSPEQIDHLEVRWPTRRLQGLTLVDTPGIASISTEVSARTHQALTGDVGQVAVADAVLYLLRHAHASDMNFMEAFRDRQVTEGTPVNTVGVLSRADEIGSCRLDSMTVAARVAERYAQDPRVRRLCPTVVPVNGLLGHAAATLRESEFAHLAAIARAPQEEVARLLLTADRFGRNEAPHDPGPAERQHLLHRFGLFGVRVAVQLISSGAVTDASGLAEALRSRSGLQELRSLLTVQFTERSRLLRAQSVLAGLRSVLHRADWPEAADLLGEVERLVSSSHELEELHLLGELRTGALELPPDRAATLERLFGGVGTGAAARLGVPDAPSDELRQEAVAQLDSWHRVARHPLTSRQVHVLCQSAVRSLEAMLDGDLAPRS